MNVDNLIKMANQVSQFFADDHDQATAVQKLRQHLQQFWTPAMWAALRANPTHPALHPLVRRMLEEEAESA